MIAGARRSRSPTAVPTGRVKGGGKRSEPCSASAARITPTAKKPSGRIANTAACEASTAHSGVSTAGASAPAVAAHSAGLRVKKASARSRGRSATVPNAAPMEKPIVTSATLDTTMS